MKFLLLMMTLLPLISKAQQHRGIVLNKNSRLPVPFATVKVLNAPRGVIAGEKGDFLLEILPGDSIMITSIGYHPLIVTGSALGEEILMESKVSKLAAVNIKNRKWAQTVTLGQEFSDLKPWLNWGPSAGKPEFAQEIFLPLGSRDYKVKKIFIPVKKLGCWSPLLLHIYLKDSSTGMPGEAIFQKLVIINKKDVKKDVLTVDLTTEEILLSEMESFFVGISWAPSDHRKCITSLWLYHDMPNSYSRVLEGNKYSWFKLGKSISKEGEKINYGLSWSVELDEYK